MKQFSNLKRAFLPCLFVLLTLPAWGQMQPVTKNFRKTPLKNVLKEVEAQTGLSIMYDTRELNLERPVTASFDRTPVSQVLREVLDRTVQYSIKDKMIVIYKASATPPPAAGTGKTLTGTVLDETGAPMVGAAVATPDGRRGTVTDSNGRYSLTLGAGDALISVSYLGYVTRQIVIGDRTEVDVNLVPDAKNTINEVVVIGYGAVKKSDLTGSVSNVKMSDIRDVPNTSVDQALQGRIAGVDIMSTSGAPGATTSIRVRGTRSISASNEPLIVVDGVIDAVSDLNDINSADIEQISVLKDASSTAIYGSRGANGVIIVTTRQGVTSKPSVTAKAEFGVSKLARDLDLMDAQEFVFKEGSYTNIWEPYAQSCGELHHYKYDINNRMDGWASLVRDSEGGAIYMLVNTLCAWRRAGKPLPQGMGPLSGVVVHTPMRRYGGDMGRYSIRPLDEGGIGVSRKRNSPWKRLTGWLLDGSAGASLEFELLGYQNLGTEGRKGDRVLNDAGSSRGYLWTDCGAFVHVDGDYNALGTQNKGWVGNGAVVFKAPVPDWYKWDNMGRMVGSNAFYIAFSTKKARGTALQLAFEWGAGNQDGNFSWNFPLEWKAEYAVDGGEFQPLRDAATGRETFVLRSLPWWDKVIDGSGHADRLRTPYDCGMGLQQRIFRLPAEAFGREEVVVRLSPASGLLSQIRGNPSADVLIPTSVVRKNSKQTTVIRFGTITVDYK